MNDREAKDPLAEAGYAKVVRTGKDIHLQPAGLLDEDTGNFKALSVPGYEAHRARVFSAIGGDVLILSPGETP